MTSSSMLFWGMIGVAALGVAFVVWKVWSGRQADSQYARVKAGAGTDVHGALQGKSFTVGTPSEFAEGDLIGHFRWLSAERAWGLRLENPKSSLRSLEGTSIPLWLWDAQGENWVRHAGGNLLLRAYNTDVSLVLPKDLEEGDQIRLGNGAEDRAAA